MSLFRPLYTPHKETDTDIRPSYNVAGKDPLRTNHLDTCLWCGDKLRLVRIEHGRARRPGARGDYGDNAFCGLRCGYMFAVFAARQGYRFTAHVTEED